MPKDVVSTAGAPTKQRPEGAAAQMTQETSDPFPVVILLDSNMLPLQLKLGSASMCMVETIGHDGSP